MDVYTKYYVFNEYIGNLGLENSAVEHFKEMFEDLDRIHFKEVDGTYTEEDKNKKEQLIEDLDSFIKNFVEGKREEIEKKISDFRKKVVRLEERFSEIRAGFVVEIDAEINIEVVIRELNEELLALIAEAKELIAEIDEFKKYVSEYDSVDFTMNYHEINKKLKNLQVKFKEIKQKQIDLYNARVQYINKMIVQFQSMNREELSEEIIAIIDSLVIIETCSNITAWTDTKYLTVLNYNLLIQMEINIVKIENNLTPLYIDLDSEIEWIENTLDHIDQNYADSKTPDELDREWRSQLLDVCARITEFDVKLNNSKKFIYAKKFEEYQDRINDAMAYAAEINEKMKKLGYEGSKPGDDDKVEPIVESENEYQNLKKKLEELNKEVVNFVDLVESLFGKITIDAVEVLNQRLSVFENRLSEIETEIEEKYQEGKLDKNQYEELMKKVSEIRELLEDTKVKLRDPEIAKDVDIFAFLNGEIDGLEAAVDHLAAYVDGLEKPIKDRNTRKTIEREMAKLEKEYKTISDMLEKHKDDDPEKYAAARARLDAINEKMEKIGKNYRKKCPFLIRVVKSAKDFYKKHKKLCLVIAGLAAIALIHATVGPVLIPAIMHGNIMVANQAPALRGFAKFVNNILGGMIGATKDAAGIWSLANGAMINPSVASTSLLKGLAISSVGSALLLTPVIAGAVVGVKKLISKMKEKGLKERYSEFKDKMSEKKEEREKKRKNVKIIRQPKTDAKTDSATVKQEKLKTLLNKLYKKYQKAQEEGMSFEEFCEQEELSDEMIEIFGHKVSLEESYKSDKKGRNK